jgi:hypothetical protein
MKRNGVTAQDRAGGRVVTPHATLDSQVLLPRRSEKPTDLRPWYALVLPADGMKGLRFRHVATLPDSMVPALRQDRFHNAWPARRG